MAPSNFFKDLQLNYRNPVVSVDLNIFICTQHNYIRLYWGRLQEDMVTKYF
jgi:hypothetical protein